MNSQTPFKPFNDPTGVVELHSIFATIQGEAIFAGHPATFVRLAGCNLKCPLCDTDYTSKVIKVKPEYILNEAEKLTAPNKLVVITGGEPFRQNLNPLVALLVKNEYNVQIETNGTLPPTIDHILLCNPHVKIVCSPKTGKLDRKLTNYIDAYKYVLDADEISNIDGLPVKALGLRAGLPARPVPVGDLCNPLKIFVQPLDVGNKLDNMRHLNAAIHSCLAHGYTLGLQIHKIINMD